jgi:hypothetical protein
MPLPPTDHPAAATVKKPKAQPFLKFIKNFQKIRLISAGKICNIYNCITIPNKFRYLVHFILDIARSGGVWMKKLITISLLVGLLAINSMGECKNKSLPFVGFFYTTGRTLRYYDLKKDVSHKIYSSQAAEIGGLYYEVKWDHLYFTELKYQKSRAGAPLKATYTVKQLKLPNTKTASTLYQETREANNLNYYPYAQYRYNEFLLLNINGLNCSYHKIYNLKTKKFIYTTGEGLYSSYFDHESLLFIHNYDATGASHEYVKIILTTPLETATITKKEYDRAFKNSMGVTNFQIDELPVLKDYPQDPWGNIFTSCIREQDFLILNTFFTKTPLVVNGTDSYLADTITFYDLDRETVVKNVVLKDWTRSPTPRQPFCLKLLW